MSIEPSPYELWKQAGGETDAFDRDRYRALLIEHGHMIPLAPGEKAEPLPSGSPDAAPGHPCAARQPRRARLLRHLRPTRRRTQPPPRLTRRNP